MLALETVRQAVKGGSGFRVVVQSLGEVRRFGHHPRLGVELKIDLDDVAFGDPARGAVRSADPDEALPAHRRDPAAPRMAVDRDGDQGPRAGAESLHDLCRNLDGSGVAGRNDLGLELHVGASMAIETTAAQGAVGARTHRPAEDGTDTPLSPSVHAEPVVDRRLAVPSIPRCAESSSLVGSRLERGSGLMRRLRKLS